MENGFREWGSDLLPGGSLMIKRLVFFVLIGFVVSAGEVRAQESAPAPNFKEGDTWRINITRTGQIASSTDQNDGVYELVFAQGKVKVFEVAGEQKKELEIEPDGTAETLLGAVGKSERRPDLKFPLSIGKKWDYQFAFRPAGSRQEQRRAVEVSVVGQEQVTVPGGSFKTYKLIRSEQWSVGQRGVNTSTSTFYYSPETKSIVKRVSESSNNPGVTTNELLKYTPGS
jgi:hypothetical protein